MLAAIWHRAPRSRGTLKDTLICLLCAAMPFALTYFVAARFFPHVEGAIVETTRSKSPSIVVDTAQGRAWISGDPSTYSLCAKGVHIVKPAFGTAYSCAGQPAGSGSWTVYPMLVSLPFVGLVFLVLAARSARDVLRGRPAAR